MALDDLSAGRPVDVGPVLRESQALGRAYDTVRDNPLGGPPDEVLATLSSPEFERILVERGPAVLEPNGELIVKADSFVKAFGSRGWGLVKILWRHGEKSEAAPRFQVTRDDLTGMPQRFRDFAPVQNAKREVSKREARWVIDNGDGTRTVYSIARRKKGHDSPTLITVFRTGFDRYGLSEKRKPSVSLAGENPHRGGKSPDYQDTAGGGFEITRPGDKGLDNTINSGRPHVNVSRQGLDGPDSRLVSMYVGDADKPASARKRQNLPESSASRVFRGEDTGQGITISHLTVGEKYGGNPSVSLAGENPHNRGKSPSQDTAGGGTAHSSRRRRDENTIRTGRPNVNFAVEQREHYPAAPDMAAHNEQAARDAADAATLQQLDEMTAAGKMDEESARALVESRDMAARAEQYDELGQSVIECIWNVGG